MLRNPLILKIWGVAISALGLWHIVSWSKNPDPNKDAFILVVGIFCLLVGMIVLVMNFKRKDN